VFIGPSVSTPSVSEQEKAWKPKEQGAESQWAKLREQEQLAALKQKADTEGPMNTKGQLPTGDIEGGYGGQEDLEDRYATTSGEH